MAEPSHAPHVPVPEWRTVPNLLSFGRLAATPVFAWMIVTERRIAAFVLLALMGITDYLDGYIARAKDQVTELGTLLDPVADRILVMTAVVTLMAVGDLPLILGVPVLVRDAALSLVFLVLSRQGLGKPKVRKVGKTATLLLLFALPALVLGDLFRTLGLALFAAGGVLYFVAAYRYATDIRAWLATRGERFP